jgi:hypothetical protein
MNTSLNYGIFDLSFLYESLLIAAILQELQVMLLRNYLPANRIRRAADHGRLRETS